MRPTGRHIAWHMRFGTNPVEYQPLEVVGVISPWNHPVNLSLMRVVTAIAATEVGRAGMKAASENLSTAGRYRAHVLHRFGVS